MSRQNKKYVIIGNGAAGTTAAEQLRKSDPNCSIVLLTNEPYPLYNRVALPRFLQGKVTEQKVILRNVQQHEGQGIQFLWDRVVDQLDIEGRVVHTTDGKEFPYDILLIATGGTPYKLKSPGAGGAHNVYNFQTLDDTKAIIAQTMQSKTAVSIGGSFISYELAEGFNVRGLKTTWVMRGPHFLRNVLDAEGGAVVDAIAAAAGVEIIHGEEVAEVGRSNGNVTTVVTNKGRTLEADMLGVGLGLRLNTDFIPKEIAMTPTHGAILTDEFLRTSVPGIFAAGDVAEFRDPFLDKHNRMGTWDNAIGHGEIAALNMAGGLQAYAEVPTYTSPLFNTTIAVMGITGETHPEVEAINWVDHKAKAYWRLFFLGERLVGAAMIGRVKGRKKLLEMMRSRTRIAVHDRKALLELS